MKILSVLIISSLFSVSLLAGHHGDGKHHKKGGFFKKMDTDGDGKVSKAEFTEMHNKKFTKIDTNNDGFITRDEKKAHRKARKAMKNQ